MLNRFGSVPGPTPCVKDGGRHRTSDTNIDMAEMRRYAGGGGPASLCRGRHVRERRETGHRRVGIRGHSCRPRRQVSRTRVPAIVSSASRTLQADARLPCQRRTTPGQVRKPQHPPRQPSRPHEASEAAPGVVGTVSRADASSAPSQSIIDPGSSAPVDGTGPSTSMPTRPPPSEVRFRAVRGIRAWSDFATTHGEVIDRTSAHGPPEARF